MKTRSTKTYLSVINLSSGAQMHNVLDVCFFFPLLSSVIKIVQEAVS